MPIKYLKKAIRQRSQSSSAQQMLEYVREGDLVKVWDISRLARDLMDLQQIVQEINDKGATIHFITEGLTFSPDQDNPMATMQLQMMEAICPIWERSKSNVSWKALPRLKNVVLSKVGQERSTVIVSVNFMQKVYPLTRSQTPWGSVVCRCIGSSTQISWKAPHSDVSLRGIQHRISPLGLLQGRYRGLGPSEI